MATPDTSSVRKRFGILHSGTLAAIALGGWSSLALLTVWPPSSFASWPPLVELLTTVVIVGAARLLAFRIFRRHRIAIDSAFYIASRFALGTMAAAWILAVVLTIDGAVGIARGLGPVPRGEAPWTHTLAYGAYKGALPSLLLILLSLAFGGDAPLRFADDVAMLWMVPSFAVTFLALHYAITGGVDWLTGASTGALFRQFFVRVVGAELSLVPMSLAMTLAYRHQGIGLFLLLAAIGLLFGGIFRRLIVVSDRLLARVDELSAINRLARTIATSADEKDLLRSLAVASLQMVGHGSLFMIGTLAEDGKKVFYRVFDERGSCIAELEASRGDGISGWVMTHQQGLYLGNVQKEYANYARDDRYNDPEYNSWLGVPLMVNNEVRGVMSVQARPSHAYTLAQLRVLATIADQAAVALDHARLFQLATVDHLTGLFVRRYFDQRLTEEWDRSARYGTPFCLGLFDLDHFKRLNDTHGHQVGDQALREAGRLVRKNMRSFDIAARYGGEEFAFILPRTTLNEAARVADRIRQDVQTISIAGVGGAAKVTASIGVAAFPDEGVSQATDLIARADAALYRAKSHGRNRVEVAGELPATFPEGARAGGTL